MLDWLRLIRFSGICTIASNTIASVAVAFFPSGSSLNPRAFAGQILDNGMNVIWVFLVSGLLYMSGMLWNDVIDARRDLELHPDRPLPSGRISYPKAVLIAFLLPVVTLIVAGTIGERAFYMAGIVFIFTMLYNAVSKDVPFLGSLCMALVRFSHALFVVLCLGNDVFDRTVLSLVGLGPNTVENDILSVYPIMIFGYILGLTVISELETRRGTRMELLLGGVIISIVLLFCMYKAMFAHWINELLSDREFLMAFISLAVLLGILILFIVQLARPWVAALREAQRDMIFPIVVKGLGGIILLEAIIAASHHPLLGLMCLLLFPCFLLMSRLTRMD
jgi:4-hydroxybenzoate polyprenyltransferase